MIIIVSHVLVISLFFREIIFQVYSEPIVYRISFFDNLCRMLLITPLLIIVCRTFICITWYKYLSTYRLWILSICNYYWCIQPLLDTHSCTRIWSYKNYTWQTKWSKLNLKIRWVLSLHIWYIEVDFRLSRFTCVYYRYSADGFNSL